MHDLPQKKWRNLGYSRVEGVDLAQIKSTIVKCQGEFLRQEHLTIPQINT